MLSLISHFVVSCSCCYPIGWMHSPQQVSRPWIHYDYDSDGDLAIVVAITAYIASIDVREVNDCYSSGFKKKWIANAQP